MNGNIKTQKEEGALERAGRLSKRVGASRAKVLLDRIAEATMPKMKEECKKEEEENVI